MRRGVRVQEIETQALLQQNMLSKTRRAGTGDASTSCRSCLMESDAEQASFESILQASRHGPSVGEFRKLYRRYGTASRRKGKSGSKRQRTGLLAKQLSVGDCKRAGTEQTHQPDAQVERRRKTAFGMGRAFGDESINAKSSPRSGLDGRACSYCCGCGEREQNMPDVQRTNGHHRRLGTPLQNVGRATTRQNRRRPVLIQSGQDPSEITQTKSHSFRKNTILRRLGERDGGSFRNNSRSIEKRLAGQSRVGDAVVAEKVITGIPIQGVPQVLAG